MKKILVIRFSSLGDVILTTPVYRNLKSAWPDCHVTVATKAQYAGVLEGNPDVDEVLSLEDGGSIFSYIGKIREKKFDICIDLHSNLRSSLISIFSGIPIQVRYRKAAKARRLFVLWRKRDPELEHHTIDRYLLALRSLGIEPKKFPPQISPEKALGKKNERPVFRILIIQTAFLGDAVLTTPLFEAVKKQYPASQLSLLCSPEIEGVFSGNKNLDEILVMDKRGVDKGTFALFRWGKNLKGRYDVVIVPHRSFRSAVLAWLTGTPKRIGFSWSQGRLFFTDVVPFEWGTHDVERNLRLLEPLGITGNAPPVQVALGDFDFDDFLARNEIPKGTLLVGMNPGSVWNTKRWPAERFAEVADKLTEEKKCRVLLFGSKKDAPAVAAAVQAMKHPPVDLCGKTDLKVLAALISKCSLFITNDSGPMHLAAAVGVPVVAIFGPTTKELGFFPYSKKSVVVELDLPCRPCALHGGNACPLGHFKCMKDITPEMVLEPARKFLNP